MVGQRIGRIAASLAGLFASLSAAHGNTYDWVPWSYPTAQTATAVVSGMGTLGVSVQGDDTFTEPWTIQFDNVPFTPTLVDSLAPRHQNAALSSWSTTFDLTNLSDSAGLIIGIGNFGFGTPDNPPYRLVARDRQGNPMSIASFQTIGSYDYTWLTGPSLSFNDDLTLDSITGEFIGTMIPGENDNNTDILLFTCPTNVGTLVVETTAPQLGGDTLNVVVAVPEPATPALLLAGLAVVVRRKR